jgi:hypothetical protein
MSAPLSGHEPPWRRHFSRIRNGDLSRFTIDRLINTLGKLERVDVQVTVRRREATDGTQVQPGR